MPQAIPLPAHSHSTLLLELLSKSVTCGNQTCRLNEASSILKVNED